MKNKALFLKQTVAQHIAEAGGDYRQGIRAFHTNLKEAIDENGLTLADVGFKNLFEAMCNQDGSLDLSDKEAVVEAMMAAQFPQAVGALIHPVIIKAYEPQVNPVLPLVTEINSTHKVETHVGFGATDQLELVREGTPYEEAQAAERYVTIENFKFGRVISVTMEMVMFDQTGEALRVAGNIGGKAGAHLHEHIVNRVCDYACTGTGQAANTTLKYMGTARAIFADDHSSWDTQVNDNLGVDALAETALNTAVNLLAAQLDDKGDRILVVPKILLVGQTLAITARKLLGTPYVVGSANNDINPFYNAYQLVVSPLIDATSATAWYIGDFQAQYLLQWVYRMRTESLRDTSYESFRSDVVAQFKAGYYAGVGATDYRFVCRGKA